MENKRTKSRGNEQKASNMMAEWNQNILIIINANASNTSVKRQILPAWIKNYTYHTNCLYANLKANK